MESPPSTTADFWEIVETRTSCRAYRPTPVPDDALRRALHAACRAPSACNRQPWRFAVVRDADRRAQLVQQGLLPGIRMTWASDAPLILVVGMVRDVTTHRVGAAVSGVDYPWIDIGIAGEHFVLAATALGLGTCWIGWIRPRRVRRIVDWPRHVRPVGLITAGYADESTPATDTTPRRDMAETVDWL